MRRFAGVLLAVFVFLLAACANLTAAPAPVTVPAPVPPQNTVPMAAYEEPVYQLEDVTEEGKTVVESADAAHYLYQLLSLSVPNLEALSPGDAEIARRNVDNFNSRMDALMRDVLARGREMGEDAAELYEAGGLAEPYYDETCAGFYQAGQVISVRLDNSSYTGGAHPNSYTASQNFDLGTGQFIDPAQAADDPESFRAGAAELLLEKAEALESRAEFWTDYAEIIARWNEGSAVFDGEGMLVIFSRYELGPYSMGSVELRLSYEELADLVGPGGMARLGLGAEEPGEEK